MPIKRPDPLKNDPTLTSAGDIKDPTKKAYAKVLEYITNTFYRTKENQPIMIQLTSGEIKRNYYDGSRIVLAEQLMDAFKDLNLPRFLIYYHELGHHLYSHGMFEVENKWAKYVPQQSPLKFEKKYHHLVNWIEDFYIEERLVNEHPYLTDVVTCIKQLPPDYDINRIEYAFNYWYHHQAPTPALSYHDQVSFKAYILKLLGMRSANPDQFGRGVVNTLAIVKSKETKYVELIIEFYNWCVDRKIFPKDKVLPNLSNPNNHLAQGQGNGQPGNTGGQGKGGGKGSSDKHTGKVGRSDYVEVPHIKNPTNVFKEEVASENKMINKHLLDMSQRLQVQQHSLDGLFSAQYEDSTIIHPRVKIPSFFNPNRLVDQNLFRKKKHTYMNVAIFRDISGSTHKQGGHDVMHHVCEKLMRDIPVDISYYLYGSGPISIVEVPYVGWEDHNETPKIYAENPLYKQMEFATNSDAIADAITQQLSDKWLNIIVTDGDLRALMKRDNIYKLLENVFIIAVGADVEKELLGVRVDSIADLHRIIPALSTINLDR